MQSVNIERTCNGAPPSPAGLDVRWFRRQILCWFGRNARRFSWRRKGASTYERVISEALLQRTQAQTVDAYLPAFVRRFPSWSRLAEASNRELEEWLRPIGLWRRRAQSLLLLAREMHRRRGRFPATREEIEELPGVGQYIANAILLFTDRSAEALVDVNMARVVERYFGPRVLADIRFDPYLQQLAKRVVSGTDPVSVNWAILDLAALICKRDEPLCTVCPLRERCQFVRLRQPPGV